VVAYQRLKTKENLKLLVLKVVTVAHERWSLKGGSKYSDLRIGKVLVFWRIGRNQRCDCIHRSGGKYPPLSPTLK